MRRRGRRRWVRPAGAGRLNQSAASRRRTLHMPATRPSPLHAPLDARAATAGDAPALLAPGRDGLTAGELVAAVDGAAAALVDRGVRAGDAVVTLLPNGPEAVLTFLATTRVATCAPMNPALRVHELEPLLDDL